MNKIWILTPLMLAFAGCGSQPEASAPGTPPQVAQTQPTASAPAVKLTATQELAKYCRVCVVDRGEKMEEFLPSRLDVKHNGQTYKFCAEHCQKQFNANKAKYTVKAS